MLKIWNMKKDAAAEGIISSFFITFVPKKCLIVTATKKPKISAAQIRVQKGSPPSRSLLIFADITELSLPNTMRMAFPNPDDLLNFTLTIEPDEGSFIPKSMTNY